MNMKPVIYLTSQDLEEIDQWIVGDEYEVDAKIKMISLTKNDGQKTRAEFEVMTIQKKPPTEIAMMRHAEFKEALADEKKKIAESRGELY